MTSAVHGEGKSSLARALAISMAQDHACDVLLMECDFLQPSLHQDFGTGPGLGEVLAQKASFDECLRATRLPNLWLLATGGLHDNPSRLLRSPAMLELLEQVRVRFAFAVLDVPPVIKSSDATVLARLTEGVIMVVRCGLTEQRVLQKAVELLQGANVYGIVLNRHKSAVPDVVRRLAAL